MADSTDLRKMQVGVSLQLGDQVEVVADQRLDLIRRGVAAAQTDDLGRCAVKAAAFDEVRSRRPGFSPAATIEVFA